MKDRALSTKTILLYFPEYDATVTRSNLLELPLPILHVAGPLLEEGFQVQVIDGRLPGAHQRIESCSEAPLFFGFSAFLGQLDDGYAAAELLRHRFPETPVVCGGWLPTLYPELFQDSGLVNFLVRGPAEETAPRLAGHLLAVEDPSAIEGVVRCSDIELSTRDNTFGSARPPSLDLPYHLLEIDHYELSEGRADFLSSRGCPSHCTFCGMASVYKGKWFPRSGEEVLEALSDLKERFGLERVQFYDDNFLTDRERVLCMAEGLIERNLDILWMATSRLEDLAAFDDSEWVLLARSGCSIVSSGVESSTPRIRKLLGKPGFGNDDVFRVAHMLHQASIRFAPFFMVGSPGESLEEVDDTLAMAARLMEIDPGNYPYISVFLYYPMPNTPLFRMERVGGEVNCYPRSIAEVRRIPPESHWGQAPWVPRPPMIPGYHNRRQVMIRLFYFWANSLCPPMLLPKKNPVVERIRRIIGAVIQRRVASRNYRFPLEWYAHRAYWGLRRSIRKRTASSQWSRHKVDVLPQGAPRVSSRQP
ncbi:MAG: B12-binding domain-containing radical SAM protein [Planctomycetota bacterium]|jgi:radical SAM superfamily enzyme YgiQ (UPF0313 family)